MGFFIFVLEFVLDWAEIGIPAQRQWDAALQAAFGLVLHPRTEI
jgi:hypothetical protein